MKRKESAPDRSVSDVGPGDYVKVGTSWLRIEENKAQGSRPTPRSWAVKTEVGTYGMFDIRRYAKAEDMEK